MDGIDIVRKALVDHSRLISMMQNLQDVIVQTAQIIQSALQRGNKVLLCGNGGSAADAQHLAAEFVGKFLKERQGLPAIALNVNTSLLTALGNDYSFNHIFLRQVESLGVSGDCLIAISTSGNSANIIEAARAASKKEIVVIGMTGNSGGKLAPLCNICIKVPSESTPRIQEMHIWIGHTICQLVEEGLC